MSGKEQQAHPPSYNEAIDHSTKSKSANKKGTKIASSEIRNLEQEYEISTRPIKTSIKCLSILNLFFILISICYAIKISYRAGSAFSTTNFKILVFFSIVVDIILSSLALSFLPQNNLKRYRSMRIALIVFSSLMGLVFVANIFSDIWDFTALYLAVSYGTQAEHFKLLVNRRRVLESDTP